jgi:hypothetical protein
MRRHSIVLPADLALLFGALTLEGLGRQLDPGSAWSALAAFLADAHHYEPRALLDAGAKPAGDGQRCPACPWTCAGW